MNDAEGTLEAGCGERFRHGQLQGERGVRACASDRLRTAEGRGRGGVTGEQNGNASSGQRREAVQLARKRGDAEIVLELEDVVERRAVAKLVGPVRVGGKVYIRDCHDAPGKRLDVDVEPVRAGRIDDRVA